MRPCSICLARGSFAVVAVQMGALYAAAWAGEARGGATAAGSVAIWLLATVLNVRLYLQSRGRGPVLVTIWFLGLSVLCVAFVAAATTAAPFALGGGIELVVLTLAMATLLAPILAKRSNDAGLVALIPTPSSGLTTAFAASVVASAVLGDARVLDGSVASMLALTAVERMCDRVDEGHGRTHARRQPEAEAREVAA